MKKIIAASYNLIKLCILNEKPWSYRVYKEPFLRNGFCIEEELSSDIGFRQEVICEIGNILEERKPSTRFEHKKSNSLLDDKANYYGRPYVLHQ
jgi:hypothetical protein